MKKSTGWGWVLAIAVAVAVFGNRAQEPSPLGPPGSATSVLSTTAAPPPSALSTGTSPATADAPTTPSTGARAGLAPSTPSTPSRPTALHAGRTYRVSRVVDGDTITLSTGAKVRLIGIDAPEVGQCGHSAATQLLASYVLGKDITLTAGARTDKDRYGRLLRYVNVGSLDAGLKLIQAGRAIARYDSRDGYGAHPRESLYIRADAASKNTNVCTSTQPRATAPVPLLSGLDPRFDTCRAAKAAGYGPYLQGKDPEYDWYRDADHDGIVCE